MLESGDWLVPRYQGEPFFDKPVLPYWLMAVAMDRLGPTPGAARLVPVLASLAAVLATVWLGALVYGRTTGLAGGVVLATSLAFLGFSRMAMADMLLVAFTTTAVALGVRACRPAPPWWTAPALGAALGLAFVTKGPIGVLVPGLAALVLVWRKRRWPAAFGPGATAVAVAVFALLGLGWFALVYRRLGSEPLFYFFLRENLERFAGESYDVGRPLWFYIPAYMAEGLPWSALLPLALWRLLRRPDSDADEREGSRFLAAWAGLVLVPLSLSRGKVDYYLLPIYPALSLLVARYLVAARWRSLDRTWVRSVLLLGAAALAIIVVHPPRLPGEWLPGPLARRLLAGSLLAGATALLAVAARPGRWRVLAVLSGTVSASWLVLVVFFLPAFSAAQPNSAIARDVARERLYRPDARMAACADPSRARRDVLFRARVTVEETCHLWGVAASSVPYLLLLTPNEHASFGVIPGYRHIATYRYVSANVLTLGGLFSSPESGEVVLAANFSTDDPVAERKRKREYRRGFRAP
jgi:4-amino-4-deoxy-L-arabinose transferase-like glycosyltransferase